jgi:hypothetical protein
MATKEYHKDYYEKNKEHIVKQQMDYQKANIESLREYRRLYYIEYRRKKRQEKIKNNN